MKVFTARARPFGMGGNTAELVATDIEEYERVSVGKGFYAIVFQDPQTNAWLVADERCGGVCGSGKTKAAAIKMVRKDVELSDVEDIEESLSEGIKRRDNAKCVSNDEFFGGTYPHEL